MPRRDSKGRIHFADFPEFTPDLTPREMFLAGIFGGTYFRPIYSSVLKKNLSGSVKEFPASWFRGISSDMIHSSEIDLSRNKYGVWSGATLEYWESRGWIHRQDPYGWVQWYMRFFMGRRTPDDARQIDRWLGIRQRFGKRLISECKKAGVRLDNKKIRPVLRQLLLQWAIQNPTD